VEAHRFGQKQKNQNVKPQLNPSVNIHSSIPPSELLRSKNRSEQITDQDQTNDHSQKISHVSEPLTPTGIQKAQPEKDNSDQNVDEIRHDGISVFET
jgi:hypothetical protein